MRQFTITKHTAVGEVIETSNPMSMLALVDEVSMYEREFETLLYLGINDSIDLDVLITVKRVADSNEE